MYQITKQYYEQKLKKMYPTENFTVLEFYDGTHQVKIRCNNCQNIITYNEAKTAYLSDKKTHLCTLCQTKAVINTLDLCEQNNFAIIVNPGVTTKFWEFECNKCKHHFKRVPSALPKLKHCPNCDSHKTDKKYYSQQEWQNKFDEKFGQGEFFVLDNPTSRKIAIKHKCGFIKMTQAHALLNIKGCPKCAPKLSKGEQKIINFLDSHNINYKYQAQMGSTRQSFDFLINNIAIEYNGEQHYKPIKIFGGEERFKQQKNFDEQKEIFCQQHNIELIVISYKDFNNIDTILASYLERFNDQTKVVSKD